MTLYPGIPEPLDLATAPVPRYGNAALSDLLPALAAALGAPLPAGAPAAPGPEGPGLHLPETDRACVFLVDGLGWQLVLDHPDDAPFLTSLATDSPAPLTAGFPSTTATSLASVGTGLPPGRHGLAGYRVAVPGEHEVMNQVRWRPYRDPQAWQPYPTVFRHTADAGIPTAQVSLPAFGDTGLTRAALAGGAFLGAASPDERIDLAAARLAATDRALVYTYYSDLDAVGHRLGTASEEWRAQLRTVDRLARRLAERLPPRTALYVTADHGMVDIAEDDKIDFDEDWELRSGVALLGGEGRARHVYAAPGAAPDVLAVWREVLGEQMWVASREEAIAAGWFGPTVDERVLGRIGDVVAAARDAVAVTATEREPNDSRLIGMHGSMTPAEQLVPLLRVAG